MRKMMTRNIILTALTATALASCTTLAPPHERPPLPTATEYPAEFANDKVPGQRATEISWSNFFADQRLEALVKQALERNRDLAASIAQIEEARAQYRVQDADRLPTLGANGSITNNRSLSITGEPDVSTSYSVGVGVTSFELDFWGRVKNLSDAARSQYLSTEHAARAYRLSLIREVASTYFASREAEEGIKLAEATVKSRQEGLRIAKRRLDVGVTSALDYRQAETLLTQAETELAALKLSRAQSNNYMAILTGGPVPAPLPDAMTLAAQTQMPALAAGLPSELMVARPDILAAEEQLRAARANIGAARAAFYPTISLTGNLGFASTDLGDLFSDDGFGWSFGPSISLPIFDLGRREANLDVAKAREVIQVATYERTVQGAFREVADALAGRRYYAEEVASQTRGVEATRHSARLARLRYQEGITSYLEVLDAERNLFSAQQALIQLQRAQADNLVALYIALGGGQMD